MKSCRKIRRHIAAYARHELVGSEVKNIQAHLEKCQRCRDDLAEERALIKHLSMLVTHEPSETLVARTRKQIHHLMVQPTQRPFIIDSHRLFKPALAVLVVVVITLISFWIHVNTDSVNHSSISIISYQSSPLNEPLDDRYSRLQAQSMWQKREVKEVLLTFQTLKVPESSTQVIYTINRDDPHSNGRQRSYILLDKWGG